MMTFQEVWDFGTEAGQRLLSEPQARVEGLLLMVLAAVVLRRRGAKATPADRARCSVDVPRGTTVRLGMDDEADEA
jgi:hypothetical protein